MMELRFDSLGALFLMDGHGMYVWACVALALVIVLANVFALRHERIKFMRDARARLARREARLASPTATDPTTGNPV